MNTIPSEQNLESHLQQLAAQRKLYSTAKFIFGVQLFLSVPVTILITGFAFAYPDIKVCGAAWGIGLFLADVLCFSPLIKDLKTKAAGIQEAFDCELFKLPRDELRTGKSPDPELIKCQADKYKKIEKKYPPLPNWYSVRVGELPIHLARLSCQRSNCYWDSNQKRRFANLLVALGVTSLLAIFIPAIGHGITLKSFILAFNTIMPILAFCYRQYYEHKDAAARLDTLKDFAVKVWDDSFKSITEAEAENFSRRLQSEIYENRKKGPLVFDFIFKHFRDDFESLMNHSSAYYAEEAKKRLNLTVPH